MVRPKIKVHTGSTGKSRNLDEEIQNVEQKQQNKDC